MQDAHAEASTAARVARAARIGSLAAVLVAFPVLFYLTWFVAPDWAASDDVSAPLTRKIVFYHPASAWTSFVAYLTVAVLGLAYLNERDLRYDRPARAAAEVGFALNTVALLTGTVWGMQEWSRTGQASLATVYSEPKVLVVVVLWLTFGAYLLLRRAVDDPDRRARLSAAFGLLGAIAVPASFLTSRLVATSLHPDIAGPGKNADAAVGDITGWVLLWSFVAFLALFVHLWLARDRQLALEERIEDLEAEALGAGTGQGAVQAAPSGPSALHGGKA